MTMDLLVPSVLNAVTALVCLGLAVLVLARNWTKRTHQTFALLAFIFMLWATSVFGALQSRDRVPFLFWVHIAEFVVCFVSPAFYHFVGYFPRGRFDGDKRLLTIFYALGFMLACNTLGPWYVYVLDFPVGKPPIVWHDRSILALMAMQMVALLVIHSNLRRKIHETQGLGRRQILFVITGVYGIAIFSTVTATIDPLFGIPTFQAYGPVAVMLLMCFFAYAMVRYHLLDTRAMVSRALVYALATAFIVATFVIATAIVRALLREETTFADILPGILTAFVVALIFQAVKDRVAYIIEVNLLRQRYNVRDLYTRLAQRSAEVVDLDVFLAQVTADIQQTIGVRTVRVLLLDPDDHATLVTEFTSIDREPAMRTREHTVLLDFLRQYAQPLILEQILHGRPDERMVRVASSLADLEAFFCLPLKTGDGLVGILTLGPKNTHDIYSQQELEAFQALAGPLATAIANARLYRALARVHLHQSNVFSQMREGVVAVDTAGRVTVANKAVRELLPGIGQGQHLSALPTEIAELLETTLGRETPVNDFETSIARRDGEPIPFIVSSSCLKTEDGETTGAVALLYDLSLVKSLERNVQRADRLSSIGTLAAGMAHEIKNPLVSIKTFTQLLADRYKDPEFRATFEEVVPHEVDRIDTIVSRLLDFARPRPVSYTHVNIRRTVDEVVALLENQLRKGFIETKIDFPDAALYVRGDDQQLHQAFLNLFLNAVDAMKQNGEGSLSIRARQGYLFKRRKNVSSLVERKCIRITVTDSGCGIPAAKLPDVFTPFFTTKPEGCGLGLAVVHGIIEEHGGEIDVASEEGKGTTFTVSLPLALDSETTEDPVTHEGAETQS